MVGSSEAVMAQSGRGTKRHCSHCGVNFYDLGRNPPVCPKCQHEYVAQTRLPSTGRAARMPAPLPEPEEAPRFDEDEALEHDVDEEQLVDNGDEDGDHDEMRE
ncbi:MAG: FYDLN acid domain-containing protein [Actinomycetota bacterium]